MSTTKEPHGDERFSRVNKDPRFWEMPDVDRRVRIDKRFQSMFHDKRFKLKYTVDKRGRPVDHTSTEDLKRFYKLSDSEVSDGDEPSRKEEKKKKKKKTKKKTKEGGEEPQLEDNQDEEEEPEKEAEKSSTNHRKALKPKGFGKAQETTAAEPPKGLRVFEEGEEDDFKADDEDEDSDADKGVRLSTDNKDLGDEDDSEDDDNEEEEEEDEEDEDVSELEEDSDSDSGPDLARGKGNIETSSEEEDGGDDEDDDDRVDEYLRHEDEEIEHNWGEMWKDAPRSEEMTRRLAVCNMDWDRIKAQDLLALFSSFKPKGGVVLSVTIYPSEFGKERMLAEQTRGPQELTSLPDDPDADTEEQRLYREKVRDYQFKRLRYYYAVVECDSVTTATNIYEECDGFEYESSSSTLDLRFIPDDVTFDDEPKDRATDVDFSTYKPKLFTSTATTTAKVELTWDETDHDRITALSRNFNKQDLLDMDFKAYLASSSEEEEDEEEEEGGALPEAEGGALPEAEGGALPEADEGKLLVECVMEEEKKKKGKKEKEEEQIAKYRDLLQCIRDKDRKEKDKGMEMDITWVPGLKETTEKLVKKKLEDMGQLTPWEEFLKKKKEKKKDKRQGKKEAESQANTVISDDDLPPDVDLSDPFFTEELGGTAEKAKKNPKKTKKGLEQRTPEEEAELETQKAEMALLMDDDEEEGHSHFNYDKIVEQQNLSKKKRKKLLKSNTLLEEDNFKVDVQDSRFQAMFTSHLYNLDPSDPAYRKTKATQSILEEKQRRRTEQQHGQQEVLKGQLTTAEPEKSTEREAAGGDVTALPTKAMDASLSMLIKSVKNKTEQFQARKKQRTK